MFLSNSVLCEFCEDEKILRGLLQFEPKKGNVLWSMQIGLSAGSSFVQMLEDPQKTRL